VFFFFFLSKKVLRLSPGGRLEGLYRFFFPNRFFRTSCEHAESALCYLLELH